MITYINNLFCELFYWPDYNRFAREISHACASVSHGIEAPMRITKVVAERLIDVARLQLQLHDLLTNTFVDHGMFKRRGGEHCFLLAQNLWPWESCDCSSKCLDFMHLSCFHVGCEQIEIPASAGDLPAQDTLYGYAQRLAARPALAGGHRARITTLHSRIRGLVHTLRV